MTTEPGPGNAVAAVLGGGVWFTIYYSGGLGLLVETHPC
jgi:hypothetical protein